MKKNEKDAHAREKEREREDRKKKALFSKSPASQTDRSLVE